MNKIPEKHQILTLSTYIDQLTADDLSQWAVCDHPKSELDAFQTVFESFREMYQTHSSADTLLSAFKPVTQSYNRLFGRHLHNQIKTAEKPKIILFSTSVSCECTLKAAAENEVAVQKFYQDYPHIADYVIIDAFYETALRDTYQIHFLPVAVVLDRDGTEMERYVVEDFLYPELEVLLTSTP